MFAIVALVSSIVGGVNAEYRVFSAQFAFAVAGDDADDNAETEPRSSTQPATETTAAEPSSDNRHTAPPRRESKQPLMQRLSPDQKAKVYVLLSTVIFLGAMMILIVWLGARATRRYIHHASVRRPVPPRRRGLDEDDWAKKPLVPPVGTDDENDSA